MNKIWMVNRWNNEWEVQEYNVAKEATNRIVTAGTHPQYIYKKMYTIYRSKEKALERAIAVAQNEIVII